MNSLGCTSNLFTRMELYKSVLLVVTIFVMQHKICAQNVCSSRQRYYTKCGFLDLDRCTRHRTTYHCCDGWGNSGSHSCTIPRCFEVSGFCQNRGTCSQSNGRCTCVPEYYGTQCENRCPRISNCDQERCTSSSPVYCERCNGDYGSRGRAYMKSSNQQQCIKQCSWRSDSNACYPGSCSNANCRCTSGFSGADCRTLQSSQSPTISYHLTQLRSGHTTVDSSDVGTVYTNLQQISSIRMNWIGSYQPTGLPSFSSIPYIRDVELGVTGASGTIRFKGQTLTLACPNSGTRDSPRTDVVDCDVTRDSLPTWNIVSGDIMTCQVRVQNGGNMQLYNRDQNDAIIVRYYTGRTTTLSSTFTFDFDSPVHCTGTDNCRTSMMYPGEDAVTNGDIIVSWRDWSDAVSGIHSYHLEVRKMSLQGEELSEVYSENPVYSGTDVSSNIQFSLTESGVYSFLLTAVDRAGNQQLARRFVLFDSETSGPTIHEDQPIVITPAPVTNTQWITNVAATSFRINLSWEGHFENINHNRRGYLNPIREHSSGLIQSGYDQTFGRIMRSGLPHVLGVTEFRFHFDVDHNGGQTIVNPTIADTALWQSEALAIHKDFDISVSDGDSARFWVEARDVIGHSTLDSILVHFDSSPPMIEQFWLQRDGEGGLAVHNSDKLHDMRIHFKAYDIHSGLKTIHYQLYDVTNSTVIMDMAVPVRRVDTKTTSCEPANCLCIPQSECYSTEYEIVPGFYIGRHDYDFAIKLIVTNNAMLTTTDTLKITIDVSPPTTGAVHDGIPESKDIDFQQESTLNANWDGFFDKESGIKFYKYIFDVQCWDTVLPQNVSRTTSTHVSWNAPSKGTYYTTVIAYNHALEPSEPVCSDGVTIDTTPPVLSQILLNNTRTKPGLVIDAEDRVWVVSNDMVIKELQNASEECRNKAVPAKDLTWFSIPGSYGYLAQQDIDCDNFGSITNQLYLAADKHLTIHWVGLDNESTIYDYQIGLSSVASDLLPDISPYVSTSGQQHFTFQHPAITHGLEFYIILRAINKAQLTTTAIYGPIMVDVTPPIFEGEIQVSTEHSSVQTCWQNGAFSDDIDGDLKYEMGIGLSLQLMDILPLTEVIPSALNITCAMISSDRFHGGFHADHLYYVSIKAINTVGLSVVAVSSPHRHVSQLPLGGVVFDVAPESEQPLFTIGIANPDIDVQSSTTAVRARWYGFSHPHLPLTYFLGVGSSAGEVDVSDGYVYVGTAEEYEIELQLQYLKTYYVSIKAVSETGNITVTSDGVTPMEEGATLSGVYSVIDGLPCDQSIDQENKVLSCNNDAEFQLSTSVVNVYWNVSGTSASFVTNALWAIEEQIESEGNISSMWSVYREYQDLGFTNHHTQTGLSLVNGGYYRSKIQLCFHKVCFQPFTSDGFLVISQPPIAGPINVIAKRQLDDIIMIVSFQHFKHNDITAFESKSLIDHYEWTLAESSSNGAVLLPWQSVTNLDSMDEMGRFTVSVKEASNQPRCFSFLLRVYNIVGLATTTSSEVTDCMDTQDVQTLVIDSDHEVSLEKNGEWREPDKNYVNTLTDLSAVWPTLRHSNYTWAVIEDNSQHNLQNGLRSPCEHPMMLKCGVTEKEYINVNDLQLVYGKRYRICIHANEVIQYFEKWTQTLQEVSTCSDGVVVDTLPPTTGKVWIVMNTGLQHQVSASEIVVNWEHFTDVEENGMASHHSGVIFYEVAIGTIPGKDDVMYFHNIGYNNNSIAANLQLQNGRMYYATVRGTDSVGLSSVSISDPLVVDDTPPSINNESKIAIDGAFLRSTSEITASWEGIFWDDQSGILFYEWAIGSQPGYSDITPFMKTTETAISNENLNIDLKEGHAYFVTTKATNGVKLTASKAFGAFRVDASPPIAGHVYDTLSESSNVTRKDYDWASVMTALCATWEGFHDPHSSIIGYSWMVGLCEGCDDILSEKFVGSVEAICTAHLQIVPGFKYFVTVTACNAAELCTSVTTDGITFDNSPPAIGNVYDGNSIDDREYIPNRFLISAHWWGFHDPQTQISHYEWRAGTFPKASDILPCTNVHRQEFALSFLAKPLPLNTTVYITVRAYNRAGLWTERATNGFLVDETTPNIIQNVTRNPAFGSRNADSQVVRDALQIAWQFQDNESEIQRQHIRLLTHPKGHIGMDSFDIGPSDTSYTLTNLSLHDGSQYTVEVIGCNRAGLCTSTLSETFLVDSSPPTAGTFSIDSEHAADLGRQLEGWMTWSHNITTNTGYLNLAWLGFSDLHSEISHYFITVGTNFDENDLTKHNTFIVNHNHNSFDGGVQTSKVPIVGNITQYARLYISIWAINKVGLRSPRAYSAFDLIPSPSGNEGALILVRRCEAHSCEGHCVCAPMKALCPVVTNDCFDISDDNPNEKIQVIDVVDIRSVKEDGSDISTTDDIDFSPTKSLIASIWNTTTIQGLPILRYEWSIGAEWSDGGIPEGVYDPVTEQVWHDIGQDKSVIVTFDKGKELISGDTYQVFVRAWYNDDTYTVFRSDGVTLYAFPPKPSVLKGAHVNEIREDDLSKTDIDYSTDANTVTISWSGVFIRNPQALDFFEVAFGMVPGGEELHTFANNHIPREQDQIRFTNINLKTGQRYFASVRAYNKAGLYSTLSSDGFIVDTQTPTAGVVYDGKGLHDLEYQRSVNIVSASWHGFYDLESYIDHYIWCVGNTNSSHECSVLEKTNVGLYLSADKELDQPMKPGQRYFSKIVAVDAAGLTSDIVVSNGFVPDLTPPVPLQKLQSGENLLSNPSFEEIPSSFRKPLFGWDMKPTNCCRELNVGETRAKDGSFIAAIYGELSQTIETEPDIHYALTFFTQHVSSAENNYLHQEGLVQAPGLNQVFQMHNRPNHGGATWDIWLRHTFHFIANDAASKICLSALGDHGMYVDLIEVEKIGYNISTTSDQIDVRLQILHGKSTVQASWQFIDEESPIEEYSWAIGTVRGGTQLQDFISVGTATYVENTILMIVHVSHIFVTVTARNKAGLRSVAYSKQVVVDTTPPEILYVIEGNDVSGDLDFTKTTDIYISWMSRDNETGIDHCDWAIGLQPSSSELIPRTRHSNASATGLLVQLPRNISDGQRVYATVWCQNFANHYSQASSDGITIVTKAPDASGAFVNILGTSTTEYPVREMFQSQSNRIQVSWQGFADVYGIQYYQCKITGPLIVNTDWRICGNDGTSTAKFSGLSLTSGGTYKVSVRAVNYAELASIPVEHTVNVVTEIPGIAGQRISLSWGNNATLTISWDGTFVSDSLLVYEISLGTRFGGSDVMQWVETLRTEVSVSNLEALTDYYMTLTAINAVGLSQTITELIHG